MFVLTLTNRMTLVETEVITKWRHADVAENLTTLTRLLPNVDMVIRILGESENFAGNADIRPRFDDDCLT